MVEVAVKERTRTKLEHHRMMTNFTGHTLMVGMVVPGEEQHQTSAAH